eukprot:772867-Pyramimonas_sp.AAC.1
MAPVGDFAWRHAQPHFGALLTRYAAPQGAPPEAPCSVEIRMAPLCPMSARPSHVGARGRVCAAPPPHFATPPS